MRIEHAPKGSPAAETFDQARLEATLRACRGLRHELAVPLSAASLHLELARRAADRLEGGTPGKLKTGLETGRQQLEETALLLDGLTALGNARIGEPGLVDAAAMIRRASREAGPELERRGLAVGTEGPDEGLFVDGFEDELESAVRDALLAAARWAAPGAARLATGTDGENVRLSFSVALSGAAPGDMLFKTRSRPGSGLGPFLARWAFEAHGGRLEGSETGGRLTVTGTLPQVAP